MENWQIPFTILTVFGILLTLVFTSTAPEIILMGGLAVLLVSGVVSPEEGLSGFSNEGMLTVGVLYIVVAGLRDTGGIGWLVSSVLGRPKTIMNAQIRLMTPIIGMSAFLNNTPVVAMLIPAVKDWAKQYRLSVSHLMIPLSYAAILGGTCTLIGTSTNLVVNGMMIKNQDLQSFGMFDIAWVGIPAAIAGITYILFFSRMILPERKPAISQLQDPREYTVEMIVEDNSPLVGKTIEDAGLRNLPGTYLMEIDRASRIIPAVSPLEILQANDRLVFVGIVESVVDLQKIRGLTPATNQVFKLDAPRSERCLIETVVSNTCPLVGKTIRAGKFRTMYDAVVIAVARNGERIKKKIGDIVLQPGDTLLLESHPSFYDRMRNSSDFFLVSRIEDSNPPRHEKAMLAMGILLAMVLLVTFNVLSMFKGAMIAAALMLLTGCCTAATARKSVDMQVLLVIAAAFGIGQAMDQSGTARLIANSIIQLAGENPYILLALVYLVTNVFTEMITNNAAAVLVFPIALNTSELLGMNFAPFAITIMMAASASFSSPIGYQTNLMVYGPGGYRFSDYMRIGIPMNILMGIITVTITPNIWPVLK